MRGLPLCPWPRPPPGLSGPLKDLPRCGCALFITVRARGAGLVVDLRFWDVRDHPQLFADNEYTADLCWDWSGLPPTLEARRLHRLAEQDRRLAELFEEVDEDGLPYIPDDNDFYSAGL